MPRRDAAELAPPPSDARSDRGQISHLGGFLEGNEETIVDFTYMISSPKMRLKILDYLPNTTLEVGTPTTGSRLPTSRKRPTRRAPEPAWRTIFSLDAVKNHLHRKTRAESVPKDRTESGSARQRR
jgi:hypothetical protein